MLVQVKEMRFGKSLTLALAVWMALSLAGAALSQVPDHNLSGEVLDNDTNDGISGASLRFENTMTSDVQYASTDWSGHYSITLEGGPYEVTVSAGGYEDDSQSLYLSGDQTYEFRLSETYSGGDGSGDGNDGGFDPLAEMDQFMWVIYLVVAILITTFVCIVITAVATTATFVRLGKVKKGLKEIDEKIDDLEQRDWQRSAPQQGFQQQPPMQQHVYQQQPGYQQPPEQMPPQQ
jgi:hypothetical protein